MAGGGLFSTLGKFFGSPAGSLITDATSRGIGAWLQNRSTNRALDTQSRYNTDALDYLKAQDARELAEYLKERERDWRYQDEDRSLRDVDRTRAEEMRQLLLLREREREGRLAPFRQGAERGYQTLSSLMFDPSQRIDYPAPANPAMRRTLSGLLRA